MGGSDMMLGALQDQQSQLAKRAHETRLREAQEAAEVKLRTVQQMCEEMAEQGRKKKTLLEDLQRGLQANEAKRKEDRLTKQKEDEKVRKEIREALMQDEYKAQATQKHVADKQAQQDGCVDL